MKKNVQKSNEFKGSKPVEQDSKPQQNSSSLSNLFKRIERSRKFAL